MTQSLEKIMEEVEINVDGLTDEIKSYELTPEQYEWFLLQASKVQELELDRNDWKDEAGKWNRRYHTSEESHLETMEFLDSTSNQYKRLKEVLEKIQEIAEEASETVELSEIWDIAEERLRGEST